MSPAHRYGCRTMTSVRGFSDVIRADMITLTLEILLGGDDDRVHLLRDAREHDVERKRVVNIAKEPVVALEPNLPHDEMLVVTRRRDAGDAEREPSVPAAKAMSNGKPALTA